MCYIDICTYIHVYYTLYLYAYMYIHVSAQDARNRTLAVHERDDCRSLVLPGSLLIFTEITGHKYVIQL